MPAGAVALPHPGWIAVGPADRPAGRATTTTPTTSSSATTWAAKILPANRLEPSCIIKHQRRKPSPAITVTLGGQEIPIIPPPVPAGTAAVLLPGFPPEVVRLPRLAQWPQRSTLKITPRHHRQSPLTFPTMVEKSFLIQKFAKLTIGSIHVIGYSVAGRRPSSKSRRWMSASTSAGPLILR